MNKHRIYFLQVSEFQEVQHLGILIQLVEFI